MDDLISRKALQGRITEMIECVTNGDDAYYIGEKNALWHVEREIKKLPSVPAVPLEMISKKLGSLCKPCISQTVGCPYKSFDCDSCNASDAWKKAIRKWMEEQDAN